VNVPPTPRPAGLLPHPRLSSARTLPTGPVRSLRTPLLILAVTLVPAPAALGGTPPAGIPGGDLAPAANLPGAPGAVVADLARWTTLGPVAPTVSAFPDGTPALRLSANTTLRSPEVDVPVGAQALAIRARSGSGAALTVVAEPADGTAPVTLGVLEPDAAGAARAVPVAAVAGRRVRLVLDPSTPLGGLVDVGEVGPFSAPLAGWTMSPGAALREAGTPPALLVRGDPVRIRSPRTALPAGVRRLLVRASGTGTVRVSAGAGAVRVVLGPAPVDISVPAPAGAAVLLVDADPAGRALRLRDMGRYVVAVRLGGLSVRRTGRLVTVRGGLGSAGAGLAVRIAGATGAAAARRAGTDGRFVLRGRVPRGVPAALVVTGDRTRIGLTRPLPGPTR